MESNKEKFERLAEEWKRDTMCLSSIQKISEHPSYQEIIQMGPIVLPYIFEALQKETDFWFYALRKLTGENPVPKEFAGQIENIRQCWLNYGKEKGYINP